MKGLSILDTFGYLFVLCCGLIKKCYKAMLELHYQMVPMIFPYKFSIRTFAWCFREEVVDNFCPFTFEYD
jgi:hypothetical protein